ncbi:SDR family NAD(P)-dependent oxidoreductase [Saccharothrix syringae]|uniref:SDR family NAD(P)-dependent oxidoreductase n=1 Tax=Saccharothrix syringae TaxID=103733 RepID=A0A5Q0GY05_SACSY|nr:SDR family NAD(P)-dependent oxidoreductase [Saccharothrix syringae]QFZ18977.1 SDR family NAD(P)-dependent oxidoreductase [Saccharothrix syringae]
MNGQTVLITGSTDGLGRHLAVRLGAAGARVLVHGRDADRAERVRSEIRAAGGPDPVVLVADLASLREVDRLADEVARHLDRLDVLVNNAGIGFGRPGSGRELSADGVELRFAVNYLAGYRLTRLLLPLLRAAPGSRIVNVASAGQYPVDFADPMLERAYDGVTAYRRAKLAQVMFTFDLAEELGGSPVVNTLHPATYMATTMVRESGTEPCSTVAEGGDATLRLITGPASELTGRYYNGVREERAHDQAYDPDARRRLRELSDRLVAAAHARG